jgi:uncharacterized protein YciI
MSPKGILVTKLKIVVLSCHRIMQFIVIAHDYNDALQRRLKVRGKHFEKGDKMILDGKALYGVALLDTKGEMNGSVYIMEFSTREELDKWLKEEPYVTGKV